MLVHPHGFGLEGFYEKETKDIELAQFLLAAIEKVGYQQYECASRLLLHYQWDSFANPNVIQRVIFHFAQALRKRIDKETRIMNLMGYEKNEEK